MDSLPLYRLFCLWLPHLFKPAKAIAKRVLSTQAGISLKRMFYSISL